MIRISNLLLCICFTLNSYSQETYSAKKGPRCMPAHYHAIVSIENDTVHYQLFNHWYSHSYAQYRDIILPCNQLDSIHQYADSLSIKLDGDKVKVNDVKYNFNKRVRHQKLCASLSTMRKISFADSLAQAKNDIKHFFLYKDSDLDLPEDEFRRRVIENFKEIRQLQ